MDLNCKINSDTLSYGHSYKIYFLFTTFLISGWCVKASGDAIFKSTSFNEGKGDYHTRCYYTDITNARREAGFVEQHLLRGFLAAWMEAGQPLGNWTYHTFKEDDAENIAEIYDNRAQTQGRNLQAQQPIVPFINTPNYTQVYAQIYTHIYTSYYATHFAAPWSGVGALI